MSCFNSLIVDRQDGISTTMLFPVSVFTNNGNGVGIVASVGAAGGIIVVAVVDVEVDVEEESVILNELEEVDVSVVVADEMPFIFLRVSLRQRTASQKHKCAKPCLWFARFSIDLDVGSLFRSNRGD
jgi:hypothetical protein